ncbi:MAG: metal ABC transporter ATP-binding protein, partial [Phycisphaerales bacterium]
MVSTVSPLEARGLSAGYERGTAIVEHVDFALRAGTMTAVVGPNGAGKSTLLKALLGLTPWRTGAALYFGTSLADARRRVAVIPQRSEIDWNFPISALDVAAMGTYPRLGLLRRIGRHERAAAHAALEAVALGDAAHAQVGELSGSQQQRVLVARALAQDAALLILDEPFANIDAASSDRIAR